MDEVAAGIFHWRTFHERIGEPVHSYYVAPSRALIDPRVPDEGIEWFAGRHAPEPQRILLTNRHHLRHSDRFRAAYGCPILCHEAGLHEFTGGPPVDGFTFGDEPAPGIRALEVAAICPEETALRIDVGDGFLAFADALIRARDGRLGFVPDSLLGDDPEEVKRGLLGAFARLLDEPFDGLLLAHGDPQARGGHAALEAFVRGRR